MRKLRVASRASALSLIQVEEAMAPLMGSVQVEVLRIVSRGDADLSTPLYAMEDRGVFEKEVDMAVLRGDADAAVHSAKDVPNDIPRGLVLAAVPRRRSPFDAFVASGGLPLRRLPPGSRVGTSSLRRISMLRRVRPDVEAVPLRGNLDTRLGGLGGRADALIVAEAGLERLGYAGPWHRLEPEDFVPAAGQGALMVLVREDDREALGALSAIDDPQSRAELLAEKSFVDIIGAGCRAPVGVLARMQGSQLSMTAGVVSPDGSRMITASASSPPGERPAEALAEAFEAAGGLEAMDYWRRSSH